MSNDATCAICGAARRVLNGMCDRCRNLEEWMSLMDELGLIEETTNDTNKH